MKTLNHQDLTDLVDGAAIFSAGGGGDPQVGHNIVEKLVENKGSVQLIDAGEVPDDELVVNFACVGATANVAYHSETAVRTLTSFEEFLGRRAYAVVPVELGGFNTLVAVDVAARRGIPVVDADGAARAVPEVHLKVFTLDDIPMTPMAIADLDAENIVLVKQTHDSKAAERITRVLATEWNQMAYTARQVLTGNQLRKSAALGTLSTSIRVGLLLRKAVDPLKAILKETHGFSLFEGTAEGVQHETRDGFTWTMLKMDGINGSKGSEFEVTAKNEVLVARRNGELAALAPDIITPVDFLTCKSVPAEKIKKDSKLTVIGIPAHEKWRTPKGLELWQKVLQKSGINEQYTPLEKLIRKS